MARIDTSDEAVEKELPAKVKIATFLWQKFGLTTIMLALSFFVLYKGAMLWREDAAAMKVERKEDQAAFLRSLDRVAGSVDRLADEQKQLRQDIDRYVDRNYPRRD